MGYYDGNTVIATYGPSVLSHINLISGQTHGAIIVNPRPPNETRTSDGAPIMNGTLIANRDPAL